MEYSEILAWLRETDPARLAELWQRADQTRQQYVGGEVHLRGLIEISNYCVRLCAYCGLRANHGLKRYRMTGEEILACVRQAVAFGYGTVVLQAGRGPGHQRPMDGRPGAADQARNAAGRDPEPRRAERTRNWPPGARPAPTAICCGSRPPTAQLYDRIHPPRPGNAIATGIAMLGRLRRIGLRSGQRRDDRHPRPDLRRPGRRHRAVRPSWIWT